MLACLLFDPLAHVTQPTTLALTPLPDVVDSTDAERMEEASRELHGILSESDMRNTVVLIMANKQDMPRALPPSDIAAKLGLRTIPQSQWFIQPTCATTGEGLYEGLDWIARELRKSRNRF